MFKILAYALLIWLALTLIGLLPFALWITVKAGGAKGRLHRSCCPPPKGHMTAAVHAQSSHPADVFGPQTTANLP